MDIIVKPYTNGRYIDWTDEKAVRRAWNQDLGFYTPYENGTFLNKVTWLQFGNKLDSVVYMFNDLIVVLSDLGVE